MKKRIFSIFALTAMLAALMPVMPVSAAASINIGEYLEMGTYYGEPILWRCVDIDENGPLMLSDKIICLKPFDAAGDNESGSHGRAYNSGYYRKQYGSDYWADSNMRSWLNSNAGAGNVTWLCGNPPDNVHVWNGYNDYADEAGFKTNFTSGELGAVKSVIQDSLLNRNEYSDMSPYGSTYHEWSYYIDSVVQNAKTSAYRERIADEFFLLDVNQINAVYNNRNILGDDYYIGRLSEGAVKNSEYSLDNNYIGNKWIFWLRSPYAYLFNGNYVRCVNAGGFVYDFYDAYSGFSGVRPAFYLNLPSSSFTSGSGTASAPYRVEGTGINVQDISTQPPTEAPKEYSLKVVTNEPSLSTTVGNTFLIGATAVDGNGEPGTGDIKFSFAGDSVLTPVTVTNSDGYVYHTIKANKPGTTKIKVSASNTDQTAEFDFTVNKANANAYTIYNIPNLGTDEANFYNFSGLYVDSFDVSKNSNGSATVSFDVYNSNPVYGAVEVYDSNGTITDTEVIGKTSFETSIMDVKDTLLEIGKDLFEGVYNPTSYKSSIQSAKTEIRDMKIPAGGYMTISVDELNSPVCGIVNQVDLVVQTGSLLKNTAEKALNPEKASKALKESLKEQGKDIIKDYTKGFVNGISHKTIGSKTSFKNYVSKLSDLYSSGYLGDLAVSMAVNSVSGATESAIMEMFKEAGDPATKALDAFWTFSKASNLVYQTEMSSKRMGSGAITIQAPDGNVRKCSDITVKCKMNDNTAVDVIKLDNNSPILTAVKKLNSILFGSSEIIGYDINMVENGEAIQPSGTAEVSIVIPEWMQSGKNISVYRADESGSVTNMNGIVNGDTITLETNHFSTYILTADDVETEAPKVEEGQTVITGNTVVSDWAAEEVKEAFDENLVPEVLKGEDLTKQVDRAEFAAIAVNLYEKLSGNTASAAQNPFGDISGNYCEDDILKAYNLNITNGITNVTFEPNALISREQVATMLTRAYKKSEFDGWTLTTDSNYPLNFMGVTKYADDDEISDYAKEAVYFMTRWDILNGVDDSHFAPKNNATLGEAYGYATREQAVVIALRSAKHL